MIPKNSIKPLELVVSALHCLREKRGSSPQNIIRYLVDKYNVRAGLLRPHVQSGLKRGLSFGLITQNSGLYRLNDVLNGPKEVKERGGGDYFKMSVRKKNKKVIKGKEGLKKKHRSVRKKIPGKKTYGKLQKAKLNKKKNKQKKKQFRRRTRSMARKRWQKIKPKPLEPENPVIVEEETTKTDQDDTQRPPVSNKEQETVRVIKP